MDEEAIPRGWEQKDIADFLPPEGVSALLRFCKDTLRKAAGKTRSQPYPCGIAREAKSLLAPYAAAMSANGVDAGYFAYWLENAYNKNEFGAIIEALSSQAKR